MILAGHKKINRAYAIGQLVHSDSKKELKL
jgi:hypothetical protein